jgi:hypothetical protein
MSIVNAWTSYWYDSRASLLDLAIVRVFALTIHLFIVFSYYFAAVEYAVAFPDTVWSPIPLMKMMNIASGWGVRPDDHLVWVMYWAMAVSAFLALIGCATRASLLTCAVTTMFITAYVYSFGHIHNREAILVVAMLALAIAPSGRLLSFDYLVFWRARQPVGTSLTTWNDEFAAWPIKLLQIFFVLMYLSATISKLWSADWLNGYTLQWALAMDGLRNDSPLAVWLSQFHGLSLALQWGVILFQSTFVLALLYPKTRLFFVPAGIVLHTAIYETLRAPFPQWIALYAVFVPWRELLVLATQPKVHTHGNLVGSRLARV